VTAPPTLPPPGWYPDPAGGPNLRWFDGARWTHHTAGVPQSSGQAIPQASGQSLKAASARLDKTPVFSVARVTALGSLDTSTKDPGLLGATIVPWTELRQSNDVFAEVDIRGVLTPPTTELRWLSGDAEIEIVQRPRYAGLPENLVAVATPMQSPAGVNGGAMPGLSYDTAVGWHPLIWESNTLFSAIRGWSDPEISVQIILCALAVAPDDGDLRPMLLAGLKARYARVTREPNVFPPAQYPWQSEADIDGILSL
jgi:Protein of unknown function (DUF2510)